MAQMDKLGSGGRQRGYFWLAPSLDGMEMPSLRTLPLRLGHTV